MISNERAAELQARLVELGLGELREWIVRRISSERAARVEARLVALEIDPRELRELVERRIARVGANGLPITNYRRRLGTHGDSYVWDTEGTDPLPPDVEPPRPTG